MYFEVHPGDVYAFPVPRHAIRRKVGKALSSSRRMKTHQTSNDEMLSDVIRVSFLNCVRAESYIQTQLTEKGRHYRGEFYDVTAEEFLQIADEYKKLELAEAQALASAMEYLKLTDYFGSISGASDEISPAAKYLLEHSIKRTNMTTNVGALIQSALRSPAPRELERRLEKVGLVSNQACQCVLFDKRAGGKLEQFFAKSPAAETWRRHLSVYAGFDGNLNPVYAADFKQSKMATSHFIDISCRE